MGKLSEIFVEIASDKAKLDTGLNAAKAQITDFSAKANSLLGALGIGLSAAAMARFFVEATNKGSDLNETMSKVKVVFGESAGVINAMADDMATKFGAVRGVTLDAAANLGLVAQGAGMSAKQAADMSVKLTRLADDASSFYNVPLDVALEKIRPGLVGEAEPLRAFGVLLSEDAVKAKAHAMGIQAVGGELTEQGKVMARVQLITEGLSKAQGDHTRTMDGYANQVRKLAGEWENLKAEMGGATAPVATDVLVARQIQKAIIEEKGLLGALSLSFRAGFSKDAAKELADIGARALAGPDMAKPTARSHDMTPADWAAIRPQTTEADLQERVRKRLRESTGGLRGGEAGAMQGINPLLGVGAFNLMAGAGMHANIADMERKEKRPWGGGHVMDSESFMRQAQEQILQKDTAKEQLSELKKLNVWAEKMLNQKGMKAGGGEIEKNMILRGREH